MGIETNDSAESKTPLGTICRTGENCPQNGLWEAVSAPSTAVRVAKRSKMPQIDNRAVDWKLVQYT